MKTGYVTHEEAMINDFMEDPEYAEELLNAVYSDGDDYEKARVQYWYDEARSRMYELAAQA